MLRLPAAGLPLARRPLLATTPVGSQQWIGLHGGKVSPRRLEEAKGTVVGPHHITLLAAQLSDRRCERCVGVTQVQHHLGTATADLAGRMAQARHLVLVPAAEHDRKVAELLAGPAMAAGECCAMVLDNVARVGLVYFVTESLLFAQNTKTLVDVVYQSSQV